MSTDPRIWVAAVLTLSVYSFLYKENVVFRFVEHIFIGLGAGYALTMGYTNVVAKAWSPLVEQGQIKVLIPIVLGLLLFARFLKQYAYLARVPLSFLVGMGSAIALRGAVHAEFVRQIQATMIPLTSVNNLIVVFGTICVTLFFFFTASRTNLAFRAATDFGRWVMMVCFGAIFASAVMLRISLFIGRAQFLFGSWIYLIK